MFILGFIKRFKNKKKRVAIIGSCATRDIFNSKFVENYKEQYEVVADQQHMSIISLMSESIDVNTDNIEGDVTPFYKNVFKQDIQKDFLQRLVDSQPDYLIIDFYADVFYGTIQVQGDKFLTSKKWQYKKMSPFKHIEVNEEYSIYKNSDEFMDMWKMKFDEFVAFTTKNIPKMKIVVNGAKFLNIGKDENGTHVLCDVLEDKRKVFHINRFNMMWNFLDAYASYKHNLTKLEFDAKKYHCPKGHKWGWFYVHYNSEYYYDKFNQLKKIT